MSSVAKRTGVAVAELQKAKATWDKASKGELSFDFSPEETEPGPRLPKWEARDKVGVKEAIIRFLEEQL